MQRVIWKSNLLLILLWILIYPQKFHRYGGNSSPSTEFWEQVRCYVFNYYFWLAINDVVRYLIDTFLLISLLSESMLPESNKFNRSIPSIATINPDVHSIKLSSFFTSILTDADFTLLEKASSKKKNLLLMFYK